MRRVFGRQNEIRLEFFSEPHAVDVRRHDGGYTVAQVLAAEALHVDVHALRARVDSVSHASKNDGGGADGEEYKGVGGDRFHRPGVVTAALSEREGTFHERTRSEEEGPSQAECAALNGLIRSAEPRPVSGKSGGEHGTWTERRSLHEWFRYTSVRPDNTSRDSRHASSFET